MAVPDRPFRIAVRGQAINGERYQRIYERLFKPVDKAVVQPVVEQMASPADAEKMSKWLEESMKEELRKIDEELNKSGGWIAMPRTHVFNVNYRPLLSPAGRPRGLTITYDVEFSENGYYNPELHVFPDYQNEEWRLGVDMNVMDGSINPEPAEAGSPQSRPNPLAYGAGYMYLGRTTYGQGVFYKTFATEGARDCGQQPTSRF